MSIDLTARYPEQRYYFSEKESLQTVLKRRSKINEIIDSKVAKHVRERIKLSAQTMVAKLNELTGKNFQPDECFLSAYKKLVVDAYKTTANTRCYLSICYFNSEEDKLETLRLTYNITNFLPDDVPLTDQIWGWLNDVEVEYREEYAYSGFNSSAIYNIDKRTIGKSGDRALTYFEDKVAHAIAKKPFTGPLDDFCRNNIKHTTLSLADSLFSTNSWVTT